MMVGSSCILQNVRHLCTHASAKHSFITTPIFYVNAAPHIGHLYSALLADAAHRWQKLKGVEPALFTTGTDEHGLKVQKAAAQLNCSPSELCDKISDTPIKNSVTYHTSSGGIIVSGTSNVLIDEDLFAAANVSYTDYIRTTESRHSTQVEQFWQRLFERGYIYKGKYEGWYSVPDETFLVSSQVTDGNTPGTKVSLETGHILEWSSEDNYLFKLTAFREQLLEWVNTKPYPVIPEDARVQVHNWLSNELTSDLSVSRPRSRLTWGITVPNDNTQTIYVWLDALVNYLTVSNYPEPGHHWPATEHLVGKDILRFHAIYWPAFLLAAGLPLPGRVVSHAHWTLGRSKMSKSKGNVVNPFEQISKFGVDPLRYFLLKEGSLSHDGDYSEDRVKQGLNSDLADTLGNLLLRTNSEKLNPGGSELKFSPEVFPLGGPSETSTIVTEEDYGLINNLIQLPDLVDQCYGNFQFNKGISAIMGTLHQTNHFLERHKPWLLVTDPAQHNHLQTLLCVATEAVRLTSLLLYPVIPHSSLQLLERVGHATAIARGVCESPTELQCLLRCSGGIARLEEASKGRRLGGESPFRKV